MLADGSIFTGASFGADCNASGEVVFNTGMVGYPESLSDPSYFGQILVLTYPIIGNYGMPDRKYWESSKIQVKGLIVQDYCSTPSHFESKAALGDLLKKEGIPAISGVDTRLLTTKLRQRGTMLGQLTINNDQLATNYDPSAENVLPYVSCKEPVSFGGGKKHIVVIDCGVKQNIIRSLLKRKIRVTLVPWDFDPLSTTVSFDGVLISNGPGDPKKASKTIENANKLLSASIPMFGICLGSQIMALASGGRTYKLKFGHRGQNQPVSDIANGRALITSQNHGFSVDAAHLPHDWNEWFVNLNDGTNEGIRHRKKPFMAVQFHPEASPGPTDADYLFDEFLSLI